MSPPHSITTLPNVVDAAPRLHTFSSSSADDASSPDSLALKKDLSCELSCEVSTFTKGDQPHFGVHFQRYALRTYLNLPAFLRPFVRLPGLRNFIVVARPTMDTSGGLAGYRQAVPKSVRRKNSFLVVVDTPGLKPASIDSKYHWVEFSLPDVFKIDLAGMTTFDDYVRSLKSRYRRAYRVRQQELKGAPVEFEHVPLQGGSADRGLVDRMWELYLKNGERRGFHVLSREDFYSIHLGGTPGLSVLLVKDLSRGGEIVTFSTIVRSCNCLMGMWCGTDYDNALSGSCSTYINSQYELVRIALQDPSIRWVDLGAQLRKMKTGVGCQGYPVSGYLRCKSKAMKALSQRMMQAYFNPAKLLTDP